MNIAAEEKLSSELNVTYLYKKVSVWFKFRGKAPSSQR